MIGLATIGGTIYYDTADTNNFDGLATDPGISGQTVTLSGTDLNGNPVNVTMTTDGSGGYLFTGLYA